MFIQAAIGLLVQAGITAGATYVDKSTAKMIVFKSDKLQQLALRHQLVVKDFDAFWDWDQPVKHGKKRLPGVSPSAGGWAIWKEKQGTKLGRYASDAVSSKCFSLYFNCLCMHQ